MSPRCTFIGPNDINEVYAFLQLNIGSNISLDGRIFDDDQRCRVICLKNNVPSSRRKDNNNISTMEKELSSITHPHPNANSSEHEIIYIVGMVQGL